MLFKAAKVLIFLVIARIILRWVYFMGFHRTSSTHWPGPCRSVLPIEHGSEDIVLTKNGLAIISSGLDLAYFGGVVDPRISAAEGKLYAVDLENPSNNATELKLGIDFEFVPHGISIWESPEGETRLFVVNHRLEAETVEIFNLSGGNQNPAISHVKTVRDPLFTSMNDVLATGPDSFYASNDGYLRYTLWRAVETLLYLHWGSIVHYDGSKTRVVAGALLGPNGMSISKDGDHVVVSFIFLHQIAVYARSTESNDLTSLYKIPLGVPPDNPWIHPETGDIWFGSSPIGHRIFAAISDMDVLSPSMAGRIRSLSSKDRPFEEYKIYDVFSDDGQLMSTSSSAVAYGNHLLVGSVMQKLVYCEMKAETTISRDIY